VGRGEGPPRRPPRAGLAIHLRLGDLPRVGFRRPPDHLRRQPEEPCPTRLPPVPVVTGLRPQSVATCLHPRSCLHPLSVACQTVGC
jgi:hypothetical protein